MFMDNAMRIIESYNENDSLKQQLAAANARVAELEKERDMFLEKWQQTEFDLFTLSDVKQRAEQAEKNFEDAKDKIAMMGAEIVRLSEGKEQAEAQCAKLKEENSKLASAAIEQPPYKNDLLAQNKRIQTAINQYVIGNIELLDAMKAALEEGQ